MFSPSGKCMFFFAFIFHWYLKKYFVYASLELISFLTPGLKWINFIKGKQEYNLFLLQLASKGHWNTESDKEHQTESQAIY